MIEVGVTGSSRHITAGQFVGAELVLRKLFEQKGARRLHFGDCVEADEKMALVARQLGYYLVCHPPENESRRAWVQADEYRVPLPYLFRNREIVNESDCLVALPDRPEEEGQRSGTWHTVRHARLKGIPIKVIEP